MVTGSLGGPTTSERTATSTTVVEDRETRRGGEGEKILASSAPSSLSIQTTDPRNLQPDPSEDDDDEEVSWQSAARASLEKTAKPATQNVKSSSPPVAKKVESPALKTTSIPVETKTAPQPKPEASPPPTPEPLPAEQFIQEELPPDFWGSESEPPPAGSYDDEAFETATSAPTGGTRATPKTTAKLPFEMPLFNELQALFPGRIVRIEAKQQKQAEESEESTPQTNEVASVVESEENE